MESIALVSFNARHNKWTEAIAASHCNTSQNAEKAQQPRPANRAAAAASNRGSAAVAE